MPAATPKIPPSIKTYYERLTTVGSLGALNEGATRDAFQTLLGEWGRKHGLTVLAEQTMDTRLKTKIRLDGMLVDSLKLRRGYWEAKDTADKLELEIEKKIKAGYPLDNTLFENTQRGVLYQGGQRQREYDLRDPLQLQQVLEEFVAYKPPQIEEFHKAVAKFRAEIPQLAASLSELIDEAKQDAKFKAALASFLELCRTALNPATSPAEVEDMLKQHILTERIFRSIFQNPDFVQRNAVAKELEKMVAALTIRAFSRDKFFGKLDYFYRPIEEHARSIEDYSEKQGLLNALYEQFFQAYSTRAADTHGIVYTPAPIVSWMVSSVEQALQREFGLGLADEGVHIIDPCVGTGTFIMELLQRLPASSLEHKYEHELHANEILLLPYYIAAQNIEHAFFDKMGYYAPFPGICFADTLNLADSQQTEMFAADNVERVKIQKQAPIRVVIGNPPYNVGQKNENDNNANRKHKTVDKRISNTYSKASRASNKNALSDPYVKFFRWATDRLGDRDGLVCYVSNNSFVDQIAFDGMRQHLIKDFTRIYTFDMGGNIRKNPKLSGTKNNVFGIQVGVTITLLIRNSQHTTRELYYARLDEFWTKQQKLEHLETKADYTQVNWQPLSPDSRNTWLTEGMSADFDTFLPMGTKESKAGAVLGAEAIFRVYSSGVKTNRDDWAYSFSKEELERKVKLFIDNYNSEVDRWARRGATATSVNDFIQYDDKAIKWSRDLKLDLRRGRYAKFDVSKIRKSLYRPFCGQYLFFDRILNEEVYVFPGIFPTPESEQENIVICMSGVGSNKPFHALATNIMPCLDLLEKTQCFPFYIYDEDWSNRRENITDWALGQYRAHYGDESISKWDIFYYVYAVLHAPSYRLKYAENLKRDLPRIPFVASLETFRAYAGAGATLAKLHRDYEEVTPYSLKRIEAADKTLDWRVDERGMKLSADKTSLRYNDWLTLANIPPRVFEYRLGNRSALDWVIDQYRVSTDPRSHLRHDPNQAADPRAIVKLVGQVVQVSLDTVGLVEGLPPLE